MRRYISFIVAVLMIAAFFPAARAEEDVEALKQRIAELEAQVAEKDAIINQLTNIIISITGQSPVQEKEEEDVNLNLTEVEKEAMTEKYDKVLRLLEENSPWFYNGGSTLKLNGISFSGLEATIEKVEFTGNGRIKNGTTTHRFVLDDAKITVELEDGFTLSIPYTTNGGILRLGDNEYFTYQDVDAGLQGYWKCRYTGFGGGYEENVFIGNGKMTVEKANEGINLPKGRYYFSSDTAGYTLKFGGFQSDIGNAMFWSFNIIDGKVTLLNFNRIFEPSDKLPGQNGYVF